MATIVKKVIVGIPTGRFVSNASFSVNALADVVAENPVDGQILAYDSATGQYLLYSFSDSTPRQAIRSLFSAGGDLTYDSATGLFSFDVEQVYTKANFDSDFNQALDEAAIGGIGLEYNSTTNTLRIDSSDLNSYYLTRLNTNLVPALDSTYDLGDSTHKWRSLYLSGNTITLGDLEIKDSDGQLSVKNKNSGITAKVDLSANNTSELAEGDNLYYTRARFDSALGDATSTSTIRGYFSAGGDLTYNSSTGEFSFDVEQVYTKANFDSDFNQALDEATLNGTGLHYDSSTNTLSIGQPVETTSDVVFNSVTTTNNVIIGGNLQVNGTTVTVNATDLDVADNMIYMNGGESSGSPIASIDVGWAANVNDNGSYEHVGLFRDATDNTFKVFEGYTPEPDAAVQINTGDSSFSLAPFAARTLTGEYLGFDSDLARTSSRTTVRSYLNVVDAGGDGSFTYDSALGQFTYTGPSASEVRSHFSAAGDLSYDSTTGVFSFDVEEVYTKANFDSDFNQALDEAAINGTGLSYDSATNTISITNTGVASGTYGSTTQIPVFTVNAQGQIDSIGEVLVAGVTSTSFDSSTGIFTINTADGNSFTTHIQDSADLVRITRGALSAGGDLSYDPSTGQFSFDVEQVYTKANFDSDFNQSLDEAAIGGIGLTYDNATNTLSIDSAELASYFSTDNITEGSNLYFTRARVDSALRSDSNDFYRLGQFFSALGRDSSVSYIRAMFNVNGDLSYDSSTGVFSVDVEQVYTKANFDSDFNMAIDEATLNGSGLNYDSATNTLSIADTTVTGGTYGSATNIPVFTVNTQGRIDSIGTVVVAGVTSIDYDSTNGNFTINTADGNSFTETITLNPFTTTDLTEGDNKYYLSTRVDSDIDARVTKSFVDALNVDADTLDGLNSTQFVRVDAASSKTSGDLRVYDNVKVTFGTTDSADLDISHNGTNATLRNNSSGALNIYADSFNVGNRGETSYITAGPLNGVQLYRSGIARVQTTTTGAKVTGTLLVDSVDATNISADSAVITDISGSTANFTSITRSGATSYAGTYGSATQIPKFTVDASGFIDSVGVVSVAGVSSTSWDSATNTMTINTADGNTFTTVLGGFTRIDVEDYLQLGNVRIYEESHGSIAFNQDIYVGDSRQDILTYTSDDSTHSAGLALGIDNQFHNVIAVKGTLDSNITYLGFQGTSSEFKIRNNVGRAPFNLEGGTDLLRMDATGNFYITATTNSTNKTSGALVVTGGLGVGGNLRGADIFATGNIQATGNLIGNVTGTVSSLSNQTTTALAEGTNLYFTNARARSAISVSGSLAYNSGTGVVSFTERTDSAIRALISVNDAGGDGSMSYNASTGVLTYTGPSAAEVRAKLSGGTGVTYNSGTGVIAIGQDVGTSDSVQFQALTTSGDVVINGNLTVLGTQTVNATSNLSVSNAYIKVADSNDADTVDIGIIGRYSDDGGSTIRRTGFIRDATNGEWYVFDGLVQDGIDSSLPDQTVNVNGTGWNLPTWNFGNLRGKYLGFDSDFTVFSSTYTEVSSGPYTASNAERIAVNTSGGTFTINLPASPTTGNYVKLIDVGNWTSTPLTIGRNGSTIEGYADDFSIDLGQTIIEFIYINSTWQVFTSIGQRGPQGPKGDSADTGTFATQSQSIAFSIALG